MVRDNFTYNSDNFPYAQIFFVLSEKGAQKYIHPVEAYEFFLKQQAKLNLLPCPDYFSTSVTSGGVARIAGVSYEDAVKRNAAISYKTMETLARAGAIDPRRTILPTAISSHYLLKDWQQKDYITFWHLVISGARVSNVRKLRKSLDKAYQLAKVDLDLVNDSKAPAAARAPQHYRLTTAVLMALEMAGDAKTIPVSRVINLNDTDRSLGCRAERDLAGRLQIASCNIQAGEGLTADDEWIKFLGDTSDDVRAVIKAGGRLSLLRPGDSFSIIYVPEIFGETDTHLRATDLRDVAVVQRILRQRDKYASAGANQLFSRGKLNKYLNPLEGGASNLAMTIHNSDGVNGATLENGQTEFVARDLNSAVEALALLIRPAIARANRPPVVIAARDDDELTEQALTLAGLAPIGGGLWSLA